MRISDILSVLAGGALAPGRTAGPPDAPQDRPPVQDILDADVVQLTLSHDGIWQVAASPESDTSFARTPPRPPFPTPRLYASVTSRYAPTGGLQASAPSRGLVVDIYV